MTRRSFLSSKRPNFEETLRIKVKVKVTDRYEGNARLVILTKKSHTEEYMYVISTPASQTNAMRCFERCYVGPPDTGEADSGPPDTGQPGPGQPDAGKPGGFNFSKSFRFT